MASKVLLVLAVAACALLAGVPTADARIVWAPSKFQGIGLNTKITIKAANAVYDSTLKVYNAADNSVIATIGTNREENKVVDLGKIGKILKPVEVYFGIETSVGTSWFSKKSKNSDNTNHIDVAIVDGSLTKGFTFKIGFEDRKASDPDRPEALDVEKDFNDFVFTVTGLIYV